MIVMLNRAIGFYEGMPLDNSNVFQTKDIWTCLQ